MIYETKLVSALNTYKKIRKSIYKSLMQNQIQKVEQLFNLSLF